MTRRADEDIGWTSECAGRRNCAEVSIGGCGVESKYLSVRDHYFGLQCDADVWVAAHLD